MSLPATSTIASLVYETRPTLNFAHIVRALDDVLRENQPTRYAIRWDSDDLVTFDIDGSRILLAYAERSNEPDGQAGLPPRRSARTLQVDPFATAPWAACLVISVGAGPTDVGTDTIALHRTGLIRSMVECLAARHQADCVLWSGIDRVFTSDDLDLILTENAASLRGPLPVRAALPKPSLTDARFGHLDVARLMDRLADQIAGSPPFPPQVPRPADTGRFEIANSLPDLPHPMLTKAASLRLALYPDPAIGSAITQSSVPQRLAIYTMNTALMLVALPVGSAILAYNVVFGENLTVSARAIAVSGTAIGLSNSEFVLSILQSI